MVNKFTTFGSCSSRDIFNSKINPGYKEFFKIGQDSMSVSIISLMSNPTFFDSTQIELDESAVVKRIKDDFEKNYLKILKNNQFDYLIMDTYYDVRVGVIQLENGNYITNMFDLDKTEFYANLKNFKIIKIDEMHDEFYRLFMKSCDLFFKFLEENCPNTKVILNLSRFVYKYWSDNKILVKSEFYKYYKLNKFRDELDKYIIENYDVYVLPFDKNIIGDENHLWGLHPTHYESKYYQDKTNQLKNIIRYNNMLFLLNESEKELKNLKRENMVLKIYQKELLEIKNKTNIDLNYKPILFYDGGITKNFNQNWNKKLVNMNITEMGTIVTPGNGNWFNPLNNGESYFLPRKFRIDVELCYYNENHRVILINSKGKSIIKKINDIDIPFHGGRLSIVYNNGKIYFMSENHKIVENMDLSSEISIRFDLWGLDKLIFRDFVIRVI